MTSPWILPGIFVAFLLVLCGLAYLAGAGFRTWSLPGCWRCGAMKVRPSVSHSWVDSMALVVLLKPYRCAGCLTRFYAFPSSSIAPIPQVAARPAVIVRRGQRRFPIRVKVIIRLHLPTTWEDIREFLLEEEPGFARREQA